MKIMILEDERYQAISADTPTIGRRYYLEDATEGTQEQNKAFHALVKEYWKSGVHPKYGGDDYSSFRDKIKRDLGEGFEAFVYAHLEAVGVGKLGHYRAVIKQVKKYEEIPQEIREDPSRAEMIQGKLKSWSNYTVKQRMRLIDTLIDDVKANGVDTKKFDEILEGMQDEQS